MIKQIKGITLNTLVITIVLLILAGVIIVTLTDDNGLITKASNTKQANENASIEEKIKLAHSEYELESKINLNVDIEQFTKNSLEKAFNENITTEKVGNSLKITFNARNKSYKYLVNGKVIELINTTDVYGRLDEVNEILYLRSSYIKNYNKLSDAYNRISVQLDPDKIKKIIIEDPISPSGELRLFYNCTKLQEMENIKNLHTENATSLQYMFDHCSSLINIDINHFDTSSATSMNDMFGYCNLLTNIGVSGFDTSLVTHMGWMFCGCNNLLSLNLINFNTSNVTSMYGFV